jgi:hypothetical protein
MLFYYFIGKKYKVLIVLYVFAQYINNDIIKAVILLKRLSIYVLFL